MLCFTLSNLWDVIPQLPQNRPRHRCFPRFFEYFFEIYIGRISSSFLAGTKPASLDMLQNGLVKVQRWIQEPCHIVQMCQCLLNLILNNHNYWNATQNCYDLSLNMNLMSNLENFEQYDFEFGLARSKLRRSHWPKVNFKENSEIFLISTTCSTDSFQKMGKQ